MNSNFISRHTIPLIVLIVLLSTVAFYLGHRHLQWAPTELQSTDEILTTLIKRRDSARIQEMVSDGVLPHDYLYRGEAKLITVAAHAKMPDLFQFLLTKRNDHVEPELLAGVFYRNNDYPQDSAQIIRDYIRRTEKNNVIILDFYDSIFLLLRMCHAAPFTIPEVAFILDGINLNVDADLYQETIELARGSTLNSASIACLNAVLEGTNPLSVEHH
jgi:hypothetical protein